ncbi:MAG TPA: DUF4197 domain-containing protein [Prolixibacteraceae bacterium]|nr:DUF4197 domain-containing protein [Prolixibacteraceae bacterium]
MLKGLLIIRFCLLVSAFVFLLSSCTIFLKPPARFAEEAQALSDSEVAAGLRQALITSTDTAIVCLGKPGGYDANPDVRIPLPEEMVDVFRYASKVPGLESRIRTIQGQINTSAEDAAVQARPVFVDAITSMPIYDVWGILNGSETSATFYLKEKTYEQLYAGYKPLIAKSLKKNLSGSPAAQETWNDIVERWNNFTNSFAGKLLGIKPLTVSLDDYVTHRALYGFFVEIAREETSIRIDSEARVNDLLVRVFSDRKKK